jgi:catechol 1,2-dioxygenase
LMAEVLKPCRLVDEITYKKASEASNVATQSAILGPFFRHDAPHRKNGDTITIDTPEDGEIVWMHGTVRCAKTNKPLPDASVDVWQASTNGQ